MRKYRWLFVSALQSFRCIIVTGLLIASVNTQAVTLEEAIESALKFDPTLRVSKINEMVTEENIEIARSRLLPQISIQGSTSQLTQTTTQDLVSSGRVSRSFTGPSVNHQFVIRQALLRPKELSALRYAELQTQYMAIKYKSDVNDLKSRVFNAWIDLLGAQQIAHAYERPLHLMQAAAKQERTRYEQGDSTKDAAIEAEAQYENSKATHVQAVETLKVKQSAFENLTKIPAVAMAGKEFAIDSPPAFSDVDKVSLWTNFQDSSLELQMVKLQELMQLERLKMTEADHKPTLDLLAAVNLAQNDATSTQGYQYRNKQVGVQYTLPIYAGGGISASVKQSLLSYESAIAESEIMINKLQMDFENSLSQLIGCEVKYFAFLKIYKSGFEQVLSTIRSHELGVKSINEVANAELIYSKRKVELIMAVQDYLRLENKLYKLNRDRVFYLNMVH